MIGEAMQKIADEAERQGFVVKQTKSGMWIFRKDGTNVLATVTTAEQVLHVFKVLISAGLDWPDTD